MGGVMDETGMLAKASAAADALRAAGGTVLFAPITFKEDGSDNPNKGIGILAGCANDKLFTEGTWNAEFCKEFSPQEGDSVVVGKRGLDAFPNTNLEELLIEKGFNTVTLTDCCATTSADGQKAATEGTFTMFSTPMSADDFTAKLKPAPAKPAAGKKVLIVLTSVDKYPDGSPTGWCLPEAVHPYYKFVEAGCDVEFASISGKATCDPSSIDASKEDKPCMDFWNDAELKATTESAKKLADCDAAAYDAVLFAGGFGVMWDFPESSEAQALIKAVYGAGKPIGAVCHGPIVFANVEIDGVPLLQGKECTGFTNGEENAVSKYDVVSKPSGPGSCEDLMSEKGGIFKDGGVFQPNVCTAGNLFTGQNPPSAGPIAEAMIAALK